MASRSPQPRLLPRFLQKQMEIGEHLSKGSSGTGNLKSIASACLSRNPGWVQAYTNNMRDLPSDSATTGQDKALDIALAEARFGKALWDRNYEGAAVALNAVLEEAFEFSQFSGDMAELLAGL